jgi:serine protease Do
MKRGHFGFSRQLPALVAGALLGFAGFSPCMADPLPVSSQKLVSIFSGGSPKSTEDLKEMQEHLRKLAEKVIPCTVNVQVGHAQGSGVIISKDGYILTAAHVISKPGLNATIILHDGRKVFGKTLGLNKNIDAGMMKIDTPGDYPFADMGEAKQLQEGQWCMATGHPGGYEEGRQPVVRFGRILRPADSKYPSIKTDCTLVGGDSGGPLFDMYGCVIGINSRIDPSLANNIHVPVDTYRTTWDRLVRAQMWGTRLGAAPWLGMTRSNAEDKVEVEVVTEGGPAEKAGIKKGDVIIQFDGKDTPNFAALKPLVESRGPGETVKVMVLRGEAKIEYELKIEENPNRSLR